MHRIRYLADIIVKYGIANNPHVGGIGFAATCSLVIESEVGVWKMSIFLTLIGQPGLIVNSDWLIVL